MQGDFAVEVRGLVKKFENKIAVNKVDLTVMKGSAFGYLGYKGANKTTLIKSLLGLTKANERIKNSWIWLLRNAAT